MEKSTVAPFEGDNSFRRSVFVSMALRPYGLESIHGSLFLRPNICCGRRDPPFYLGWFEGRLGVGDLILRFAPAEQVASVRRRPRPFLHATLKIDEIPVNLLEREAEREELLGPGDRQRARQPLAAERRDL